MESSKTAADAIDAVVLLAAPPLLTNGKWRADRLDRGAIKCGATAIVSLTDDDSQRSATRTLTGREEQRMLVGLIVRRNK